MDELKRLTCVHRMQIVRPLVAPLQCPGMCPYSRKISAFPGSQLIGLWYHYPKLNTDYGYLMLTILIPSKYAKGKEYAIQYKLLQ